MTQTNEIPMEHMSGSDGIPGTNVHQSQYQTMWKTLSIVLLLLSVFFHGRVTVRCAFLLRPIKNDTWHCVRHSRRSSRFLLIDFCSICRLAAMKGVEMSASMLFREPKGNNIYIFSIVWLFNTRARYKFEWIIIQFHSPNGSKWMISSKHINE